MNSQNVSLICDSIILQWEHSTKPEMDPALNPAIQPQSEALDIHCGRLIVSSQNMCCVKSSMSGLHSAVVILTTWQTPLLMPQ